MVVSAEVVSAVARALADCAAARNRPAVTGSPGRDLPMPASLAGRGPTPSDDPHGCGQPLDAPPSQRPAEVAVASVDRLMVERLPGGTAVVDVYLSDACVTLIRMATRVQVILSEEDRAVFARRAAAEGLSLSAWLREAGRQRLRSEPTPGLRSPEALRAFFATLPEANEGREPDWEDHLSTIAASRREGLTST